MKMTIVLTSVAALAASSTAFGQDSVDLKITEIWAGVGGPDHTTDWFEISNLSTTTSYPVSTFFADDSSASPTAARALNTILTIGPGESVIFLMDVTAGQEAAQVATFRSVWGLVGSPVQVGYVSSGSGLGLGQGGDAVNIFRGNTTGSPVVIGQSYPSYDDVNNYGSFVWNVDLNTWDNSRAVVGVWGAYNSLVNGGDGNRPAVASPGVHIPAPGATALAGVGAALGFRRRR